MGGEGRGYLEGLHARDGDDVVVARVAAGGRAGVDGDEVESRTGAEEGTFQSLRVGSGCGELDAVEICELASLLSCFPAIVRSLEGFNAHTETQ